MILLVFFLFIYQFVIADIQQYYVVINCSWPCPNISDTCILTRTSAQCQLKGDNEWNIITPSKSPVYTGAYSSVENHTCIPAPIPNLPIYQNSTVLTTGQTVIQWPIVETYKSLDNYLGNCKHGMFCSSTGQDEARPICRRGYAPGSKCISSNQCKRGFCESGTCHQKSTYTEKTGQSQQEERGRQTHNTIIIAATIVSILGAIVILLIVFTVVRYRRRRVKHSENKDADSNLFNEVSDFDNSTLKRAHIIETKIEEENFTPSMQQNVLQKELLKSHHKHHAKPSTHQI
ncbi:hypothetical protein K501DRAFT_171260 [Backusella circina FSU 941]|nr:hypothetical protein K501DRAFT_171260 [Backusella circina FSU 941]